MAWINQEHLMKQSEEFIKNNPSLKISKVVNKQGTFVFYRNYKDKEYADFRIILVMNGNDEGWSIDYMRHTGKWENLHVFGSFKHCLDEIKEGKYEVLKPLK